MLMRRFLLWNHKGPKDLKFHQAPQAPFIEGDMTNLELKEALMNLTQPVMVQAQFVSNKIVAQVNQGDNLNLM